MKYCPNCGAQLPDNAMFCSACGARFGAPQQPYQQPQYQQPQYQQPQKMTYWEKVKAAQKKQKIKWWMWPIIAVGTYLLLQLFPIS
ncbi:MAG: zinc ribbon domain-containing protein [Bacteroidales bacterium]|nr:zinc ribbon domain-containing protein [Bacteroidales bacterium]